MPVRGRVKWFSSKKGYGFIACDGAEEVFAHYSDIAETEQGFRYLESGAEVEFDLAEGERGPRATNIVKIETPDADKNLSALEQTTAVTPANDEADGVPPPNLPG